MELWQIYFLSGAIALGGVAFYALIAIYAERKISAFIQDRIGPMETGKWGTLQTLADIVKVLQKEIITPTGADKFYFAIAPIIIFCSIFLGFSAIPFSEDSPSLNVGVFFILAIVSLEVPGILMAGWGSNNKYALMGAVRSVAQIVSYEIPAGLSVLAVVMICQTMNLNEIILLQGTGSPELIKFMGFWDVTSYGGIFTWNILKAPHMIFVFVIFFIATLAESNRAPFDLPEAESELVAGFHVEYGGFRFASIFLAEYAMMLLVSLLGAILFFGGTQSPIPNLFGIKLNDITSGTVLGVFWLFGKAFFIIFIQMWIRWSFPRLRVDQLMKLCWKVLTPAALIMILISAVWRLWVMI
ncbi:MAG: NADH-quinone oxidoreductase subunit H [Sphingobacteriales bacterium]|jgi:NADH-quinone oxidoreductase subunit H